jgi:flagellar biosynthesis/type III secretory pathway M-ring protein FliF/YscJ
MQYDTTTWVYIGISIVIVSLWFVVFIYFWFSSAKVRKHFTELPQPEFQIAEFKHGLAKADINKQMSYHHQKQHDIEEIYPIEKNKKHNSHVLKTIFKSKK